MPKPDDGPVLVWLRQDLRLADNPAFAAAAASGRPVIPFYVLDETPGIRRWGEASLWWLDRSLAALDADLRLRGSRLVLRRGEAAEVVATLAQETGAGAAAWSRLYDPAARRRDDDLQARLQASGVEVFTGEAALMNEPEAVLTGQGAPYKVFGAWWRTARPLLTDGHLAKAPDRLEAPQTWPPSDPLSSWRLHPTRPDWSTGFDWTPGEAGATAALDRFVDEALSNYSNGRDRPDTDGSSRLSPHLHWGEIGPRQVRRRLQLALHTHEAPDGEVEAFTRELGWRDFNHQLLFHHPRLASENLDRGYDRFPWRSDPEGLEAWRRGLTGYPIVDAAMRQLWTTGWMHNRMRMVTASFLIKDLLIDWREGEAWFWDTLVDADAANNAANWQWVAGCGADAQPFFRIFNPVAQGQRHDPHGDYVRRWVPELAQLSARLIHQPWTGSAEELTAHGVSLGETYPQPIVDHAAARTRALAALRQMRG